MQLKVTVDKTKGIVVSPAAASADAGLHLAGEVGGTTDATTLEGTPGVVPASVTGASAAAALALTIGARFGRVVLAPLGSGADDWARLVAVLAVCAGKYPLICGTGTWYCLSKQNWISNSICEWEPNSTIRYDLRPIGDPSENGSVFYHWAFGGWSISTYLKTTAAEGQSYIDVLDDKDCAVGSVLILKSPTRIHAFKIMAIAAGGGSGGSDRISLDSAIPCAFVASGGTNPLVDSCIYCPTSVCRNVKIEGNGCRIVPDSAGGGRADKIVELAYTWDCAVSGFDVDLSGSTLLGCSFDLGGVRNRFERMVADGGGVPQSCLTLEGQRDSAIIDSYARNALAGNFKINCSDRFEIRGCHSDGGAYGVACSRVNALDLYGCSRGRIDIDVSGASNSGVIIGEGSRRITVSGNVDNCVIGVKLAAASTVPLNITIDSLTARACTTAVSIEAGVKGTIVTNLRTSGSTDYAVIAADDMLLSGYQSDDDWVAKTLTSGTVAVVDRMRTIKGKPGFDVAANTTLKMTNSDLVVSEASYGIWNKGRLLISSTTITQAVAGCTAIANDTTGTCRIGFGYDGSACTNRFGNSGYASRGVITFSSDAAVDVTWPDICADSGTGVGDRIQLTLTAASGTPTNPPVVVITDKTKFTLTPAAGDRSTYAWEIR